MEKERTMTDAIRTAPREDRVLCGPFHETESRRSRWSRRSGIDR